ncbi:MAG TPA: hypothetical protein VJK29_09860, partial [Terriglobales bacterium]|nr:hypothetical protein [Terriglobales bacterium]
MAAASIKSREATEAPQTGWSLTRKSLKTHCETWPASEHPVRAFSEPDHCFLARPALLLGPHEEGNKGSLKNNLAFSSALNQAGDLTNAQFPILNSDPKEAVSSQSD